MKKCRDFFFSENRDLEIAVKYLFFYEKGWGKLL